MPLEADAVDRRLDGAVEQFHDEYQEHGRDQQCSLHAAMTEPEAQGYDERGQGEFLAKGRLFAKGAGEAVRARSERTHQAQDPARLVAAYGCAVGFHARSSCRAARTSSRRRTGMVCGALVTRPGSCSASFCMSAMAVTKASSVSLPSVSVGSMSRHSGTSRGK